MADEPEGQTFTRELRTRLLQVAIPAGLATALLYSYGWMFAREMYRQMGIDTDVLDFSTTDYVLRSIDSFVSPIPIFAAWGLALAGVGLIVAALLLEVLPRFLRRRRSRAIQAAAGRTSESECHPLNASAGASTIDTTEVRRDESRIARLVVAAGAVLAAVALLSAGLWRPLRDEVGNALFVLVLVTVATAAAYSVRKGVGIGLPRLGGVSVSRTTIGFCTILLLVVLVWSLFNATLAYAKHRGTVAAVKIANESGWRPEVVVFSRSPLGLENKGAVLNVIDLAESAASPNVAAHLFRYSGLLMVTEAGGKLVLWPCELKLLDQGAVIIDSGESDLWLDVRPVPNRAAGGEYVPCSGPFAPLLDHYEHGDRVAFLDYLEALESQYVRRPATQRSLEVALFLAGRLDFTHPKTGGGSGAGSGGAVPGNVSESLCDEQWWARTVEPVQELTPLDLRIAICGED